MTAADVAETVLKLGIVILAVLGAEAAFYKIRYAYRTWRVRRLIKQEQRQFEDWLETQW